MGSIVWAMPVILTYFPEEREIRFLLDRQVSTLNLDEQYMQQALDLAARGMGWTSPNPMVGAVLVRDGQVVGEGFHRRAGTPHAEIHALQAAGPMARGATLYVNLEPCCHHGRTPPCTEAIIQAGVARVVAAMEDPNPLVAGRGLERLRTAGIQTECGVLADQARRLNEVFCKYISTGLPYVVMKAAMTLDGRIATRTGDSRWVTGPEARQHVHQLRHRYDAIMVGVGTVVADNPRLTTRLAGMNGKNPLRVIVDSTLRISLDAEVVLSASVVPTVVACLASASGQRDRIRGQLAARGVEVWEVPGEGPRVDLINLVHLMGKKGITSILVEGGAEVHGACLTAGIVDKVMIYIAPKIAGGREAPGPVGGHGVQVMADAVGVKDLQVCRLGPDVLLTGYL